MVEIFRTVAKIADFKTTVLITRRERRRQGARRARDPRAVARARTGRSSRSTAARFPRTCSRASSSGTRRARSPTRSSDKRGLFEEADGGTLFLDEIGELPLDLQVKLLRVLQEEHDSPARRLEATSRSTCASSPRRIAISRAEVKAGRFREDLFYRINVLHDRDPAAARAARGRHAPHRSLRRAQQRAARHAHPRRSPPRRASCSSSTRGRGTCASSRTRSSARWCCARPTSFRRERPARARARGARPRAGAARDRRALDQEDDGASSKSSSAARSQKTKGNRTRAAEIARDQPSRAALQDQGLQDRRVIRTSGVTPSNRALLLLVMVVGCGGSDKPAENASSSSGDCPAGMVKARRRSCVAPEGQSGPGKPPRARARLRRRPRVTTLRDVHGRADSPPPAARSKTRVRPRGDRESSIEARGGRKCKCELRLAPIGRHGQGDRALGQDERLRATRPQRSRARRRRARAVRRQARRHVRRARVQNLDVPAVTGRARRRQRRVGQSSSSDTLAQ